MSIITMTMTMNYKDKEGIEGLLEEEMMMKETTIIIIIITTDEPDE